MSRGAYFLLLLIVASFLGLALVVGLIVGSADLSVSQVLTVLNPSAAVEANDASTQIILEIRLPRVLGAALVGATLAIVGAALQAVMRNPLADPYILGVSAGASVGAASSVVLGTLLAKASLSLAFLGGLAEILSNLGLFTLAFGSALVSVLVVYRVALVDGRVPPVRLLLAGVALSSFATAITGFLLYLAPEAAAIRGVIFWLMGGFGGADWPGFRWTLIGALPPLLLIFGSARWQNLLLLGDEAALSLGLDVARARKWLIGIAALATGVVVAFSGAIGFVGLIVPHALRPLTGPDHRRLLPAAFLVGALLLVVMDTIARTVIAPQELPVGILTGLLGAPFFLILLRRFEGDHG